MNDKKIDEKHNPEVSEINKLRQENEQLKKLQKKREKWIEKDERLAAKPRVGRLVTVNDLNDPAFKKKYPNAKIGDEFNDPEPLFWKLGLKRAPTMEEKHAQVAAQFARDVREAQAVEDQFFDEFDDEETDFTESEVASFLHEAALNDARIAQQNAPKVKKIPITSPTGEKSEGSDAPQKADQKPSDASKKETE